MVMFQREHVITLFEWHNGLTTLLQGLGRRTQDSPNKKLIKFTSTTPH
jgi:hypothetical protein